MLNSKFKLFASSILTFGILFCPNLSKDALSVDINQKKELRDQLREKESIVRKKLIETQENIKKESENKENLDLSIKQVEEKIDASNEYINDLRNQILQLEEHIKEIEDEIDREAELLKEALVLIYKSGDTSTLDIVLGAKDFNDFLEKSDIIKSASDTVKEMMDTLEKKANELSEEKSNLDETRKKQEDEKKNLEANKAELQELLDRSNELISQYNEDEKNSNNELKNYDNEIKEVDEIISRYYEEQRRQEEERRKREAKAKNKANTPVFKNNNNYQSNNHKGGYAWPVPGFTRISSDFYDCEGRSRQHGAIDIARTNGKSIYGANVVAAGSGNIVTAGVIGGYGNSILIDHGNGVLTRYSHLSKIAVRAGQHVSSGQVIGQVGSTGHSTGPHLDFEFIEGGVRKNPLNYVTPA